MENNKKNLNKNMNNNIQKVSIGLAILSFIIPLAGLILFIVTKNNKKARKTYGICALVSFIISFLLCVLLLFVAPITITAYLDNARASAFADTANTVVDTAKVDCISNNYGNNQSVTYNTDDINNLVAKKFTASPFGGTYNISITLNESCAVVAGCLSSGEHYIEFNLSSDYYTRDDVKTGSCSNAY